MKHHALLTIAGRDRPGIVAQVTRILLETGCNITDSSMTRLGGAFTVMLILRLPPGVATEVLEKSLRPLAGELRLISHLEPLTPEEALAAKPAPPEQEIIITVLGADRPGIVHRVTQLLADQGGNITDLHTRVIGSSQQPVYAMAIEAELNTGLEPLRIAFETVARQLGVEISLRSAETTPL